MKIRNILYTTLALACTLTLSSCGGGGGGGGESAPSDDYSSTGSNGDSNSGSNSGNNSGNNSSAAKLFLMRNDYNAATITINCSNFQGTFDCVKGGRINTSNSYLQKYSMTGANGTGLSVGSYSTWSQENWNSSNIELTLTIMTNNGNEIKVSGLTLECPNGNTSSSTVSGAVSGGVMRLTPGGNTGAVQTGSYKITYHQ